MAKKVEVTARDIRLGGDTVGYCDRCPISLAARRVSRGKEVLCGYIDVGIDGIDYVLPKKALRFQDRLMAGKSAKPFSFLLRLRAVKRG